jgi:L-alanine-DL-glutamate epimerase-like enolase superfamily enzyme
MRGFLQPAIRPRTTEPQQSFGALSRHRRARLARAAHTTLVKADQWSRGDKVAPEVASQLESALHAFLAKSSGKKA